MLIIAGSGIAEYYVFPLNDTNPWYCRFFISRWYKFQKISKEYIYRGCDMVLKCIVVDKNGKQLSKTELENKVIDVEEYYNIVLPIRKKINDEISTKEIRLKSSWNILNGML